jgi:hypothetical protein
MYVSEGDQIATAGSWDAQAEYDIGIFMRRYLRKNPPPPTRLSRLILNCWS